jgi:HAD superfamily hydrolase (TIGR01509 family)
MIDAMSLPSMCYHPLRDSTIKRKGMGMLETIQAVIFDMDGLLIDSEPCCQDARLAFVHERGKEWTHEDHLAIMGRNTREWSSYMQTRLQLEMSQAEIEADIIQRMLQRYAVNIPFLPGALEVIAFCATRWPVGLASGSPAPLIQAVTSHPEIARRLQVVISADEVPHGKPAPDVYLEAAARLGYDPTACLCFEDSANGILAGHAARLSVVAVPDPRYTPPPAVLSKATYILSSLTEFIPLAMG